MIRWQSVWVVGIWSLGVWPSHLAAQTAGLAEQFGPLRTKRTTLSEDDSQRVREIIDTTFESLKQAESFDDAQETIRQLNGLFSAGETPFSDAVIDAVERNISELFDTDPPEDPKKRRTFNLILVNCTSLAARNARPTSIRFLGRAGEYPFPGIRYLAVMGMGRLVRRLSDLDGAPAARYMPPTLAALTKIGTREDNSTAMLETIYEAFRVEREPTISEPLLQILEARRNRYAIGAVTDMRAEAVAMDIVAQILPTLQSNHDAFVQVIAPLLRYSADAYAAGLKQYEEWLKKNVDLQPDDDRQIPGSIWTWKPKDFEDFGISPVAVNELEGIRTSLNGAIKLLHGLSGAIAAVSKVDTDPLNEGILSGNGETLLEKVNEWIGPGGQLIKTYRVPVPTSARSPVNRQEKAEAE
jgi:hypothetical protein